VASCVAAYPDFESVVGIDLKKPEFEVALAGFEVAFDPGLNFEIILSKNKPETL
jgi:hypothetical protein